MLPTSVFRIFKSQPPLHLPFPARNAELAARGWKTGISPGKRARQAMRETGLGKLTDSRPRAGKPLGKGLTPTIARYLRPATRAFAKHGKRPWQAPATSAPQPAPGNRWGKALFPHLTHPPKLLKTFFDFVFSKKLLFLYLFLFLLKRGLRGKNFLFLVFFFFFLQTDCFAPAAKPTVPLVCHPPQSAFPLTRDAYKHFPHACHTSPAADLSCRPNVRTPTIARYLRPATRAFAKHGKRALANQPTPAPPRAGKPLGKGLIPTPYASS